MNSPRMKRFGQFLLVIFALVCVLMTAAFAEGDVEHTSFVWGTVASLLPPVAAIVLALITKEVYSSLFLGIIVGCFLYTNGSPIDAFQDFVSRLTSNAGGNMGILMFLVILGTMVALMIRAGGSKAEHSAALFLRLGVAVAGGRIRLLVPDAGFSAVAQLDGYVPIPPPFYIVPAKMSAGFTGLFPVHCNHLLT